MMVDQGNEQWTNAPFLARGGIFIMALAAVLSGGLAGCSSSNGSPSATGADTAAQSDTGSSSDSEQQDSQTGNGVPEGLVERSAGLQRAASPSVSPAQVEALVSGNNQFAFEMNALLAPEGKNFVWSPLGISLGCAMLEAAAYDQTEQELLSVLHFPDEDLLPTFSKLVYELAEREEGDPNDDSVGLALHIPSAVFVPGEMELPAEFMEAIATSLGAPSYSVPPGPKEAASVISWWYEQETDGMIKDFLTAAHLVDWNWLLANAVFFEASWADPFPVANTAPGTFNGPDGAVTVDMMNHSSLLYGYEETDTTYKVRLPYVGDKTSMVIIMPKQGQFESVRTALKAEDFVVGGMLTDLDLTMPKFDIDTYAETIGPDFDTLGTSTFAAPGPQVTLSAHTIDIVHRAVIEVGESGTRAAAATALIGFGDGLPPYDTASLTIDRPFFFAIRDDVTKSTLFLGQVLAP